MSARFGEAGLMLAIIIVFELPPSESCTEPVTITSMAEGARWMAQYIVREVRQKYASGRRMQRLSAPTLSPSNRTADHSDAVAVAVSMPPSNAPRGLNDYAEH